MRISRYWLTTAAVFFVLSLGPYLKVMDGWRIEAGGRTWSIPLPWWLLHGIPPFYRLANHFRFSVFTMLALGMAVAPVVSWLTTRAPSRWRVLVAPALSLLILAEYCFLHSIPYPRALTSTAIPPLYDEIAAEPGDFAVAELPLGIMGKSLFYQTRHERPVLMASPERARRVTRRYPLEIDELLDPATTRARLAELRSLRVRYLIVHDEFVRSDAEREALHAGLQRLLGPPAYQGDGVAAYRTQPVEALPSAEEAEYDYRLANAAIEGSEYEVALRRLNRAIALADGVARYYEARARVHEALERQLSVGGPDHRAAAAADRARAAELARPTRP